MYPCDAAATPIELQHLFYHAMNDPTIRYPPSRDPFEELGGALVILRDALPKEKAVEFASWNGNPGA